jgi:hypothetical protein
VFFTACLTTFLYAGEKAISLSDSNKPIDKIPHVVIPYGEGKLINLSEFKLTVGDVSATGTIEISDRTTDAPFTLVLFMSFGEDNVVCYFDQGNQFFISNQTGEWAQNFKPGYTLSKKQDKSIIRFSFDKHFQALNARGSKQTVYNIDQLKGHVYAFCVNGEIQFMSAMPGNQKDKSAFHANSNVTKIAQSF